MHPQLTGWIPFGVASLAGSLSTSFGLSNLIALAIIAVGGLFTLRLNIGKTMEANWRAEKERGDRLEEQTKEQSKRITALETELKTAQLRTDLSGVMAGITQNQEALTHLTASVDRFVTTMQLKGAT